MEYGNIGTFSISQESKFHNNEKGFSKMRKAFRHNERISETEIVYKDLTEYNHSLVDINKYIEKYGDQTLKAISDERKNEMSRYTTERTKKGEPYKLSNDAVIMFEAVLTYVRPYEDNVPKQCILDYDEEERKRWEEESISWAREQFRDPVTGKDNVVMATVHYDEASPHIHLMVVPEYNGRYNQKYYIGNDERLGEKIGTRVDKLSESYNRMMYEEFGLGLRREKSRMQRISVKKNRENDERVVSLSEKFVFAPHETLQQTADRANETIREIEAEKAREISEIDRKIDHLKQQIIQPDLTEEIENDRLVKERKQEEEKYYHSMEKSQEYAKTIDDARRILEETEKDEEAREKALRIIKDNEELMQMLISRQHEIEREEREQKKRKKKSKYIDHVNIG